MSAIRHSDGATSQSTATDGLSLELETVDDCAARLGISRAAAELFHCTDVVDLHIDTFIWQRLLGYKLEKRHNPAWYGARFLGQVDIPRLRQGRISGATWVITTNPLRSQHGQRRALASNIACLRQRLCTATDVAVVETFRDYVAARAAGKHAAFLGVQGGSPLNGLDFDDTGVNRETGIDLRRLLRVTLLHLTSTALGTTSAPTASHVGLSTSGKTLIEQLNHHRVLVDLAHISESGFFKALDAHSKTLPPIVTHTGVAGVYQHWRNLSDAQLKAIAERDGIIGIMYHTPFLQRGLRRGSLAAVVAHISHAVRVVGIDHVALGSDWDGAITTPTDMRTCLELPRLVEALLHTGFVQNDVIKILGANFLRLLRNVRP